MGKQAIIQKGDKEKVVLWACLSIRPFTIVEDSGFMDIVKEAINLSGSNVNVNNKQLFP
jgi:hypothetical protein